MNDKELLDLYSQLGKVKTYAYSAQQLAHSAAAALSRVQLELAEAKEAISSLEEKMAALLRGDRPD